MSVYSKYNLVYRLQKWMDTVQGQTFLNYAYSWGASVVILGALFKLTHLPGANLAIFIGMGTEVLVFFISAFDRPFDKTADGREIPTRVTEEYLANGTVTYSNREEAAAAKEAGASDAEVEEILQHGASVAGRPAVAAPAGGVPVQPGVSTMTDTGVGSAGVSATADGVEVQPGAGAVEGVSPPVQPNFVPQMSTEEAEALNEAQSNYVDQLKELVETLKKVNEQSTRLTRDSEEMENLNRVLTGISKVYELQLKGASQQIGTIDKINASSMLMAQQIDQLNQIYSRMIEAMTVNMRAAAPSAQQGQGIQPGQL